MAMVADQLPATPAATGMAAAAEVQASDHALKAAVGGLPPAAVLGFLTERDRPHVMTCGCNSSLTAPGHRHVNERMAAGRLSHLAGHPARTGIPVVKGNDQRLGTVSVFQGQTSLKSVVSRM